MIKKILLTIVTTLTLFGSEYDEFLLQTQLSLLPKIALLEKSHVAQKDSIDIVIVHDHDDEETARYAAAFLEKKFHGKIGKFQLNVFVSSFDRCCPPTKSSIVYCLNGSEAQLARVRSYAQKSGSITAVYDSESLKNGFLFSVILEKTPVVLMNKKTLKEQQFDFPQNLYAIVRPL